MAWHEINRYFDSCLGNLIEAQYTYWATGNFANQDIPIRTGKGLGKPTGMVLPDNRRWITGISPRFDRIAPLEKIIGILLVGRSKNYSSHRCIFINSYAMVYLSTARPKGRAHSFNTQSIANSHQFPRRIGPPGRAGNGCSKRPGDAAHGLRGRIAQVDTCPDGR